MSLQIPVSKISGVQLVDLDNYSDFRGSFSRLEFEKLPTFPPNSFAVSQNAVAGTTRGLHYQKPPYEQAKLIFCVNGSFDDYFLDLRNASPSYGKWAKVQLKSEEPYALFLPKGIAHGFQTLESNTTIAYLFDNSFNEKSSAAFLILDPKLGIDFALPISSISELDRSAPQFLQESDG